MVKDEINNLIDDKKVMDLKFMKDFIEYYANKNKLHNEVKDVQFDDYLCTHYDNKFKKVVINYEQLMNYASSNYREYQNVEKYYSYFINYDMVFYLIHELTHAKQINIINNNDNALLQKIYSDSYDRIAKLYKTYTKNHDYFVLEYNANVEGQIGAYEFMTSLENCLGFNFYPLYIYMEEAYRKYKKNIVSPVQRESVLAREKYDNKEIINSIQYKNLSNYEKIINGLPINNENYKKIKEIQFMKKLELKRLFK